MNSRNKRFLFNTGLSHVGEKLVIVLLSLSIVHVLWVLLTGGYKVALGPLQISASRMYGPLLLLLGLAMVTAWLRGKRLGISPSLRLRSPWLLCLGVLFIYSLNGRALSAGDTIPASYLPFSLLREFDFDLDEFPFLYGLEMPWFLQRIGHHIVSSYPPWAGVLALPVYMLPVLGGLSPQAPLLHDLEKLSASLIVALSVVLLQLALRRLTNEKIAWVIALVYAFGTSSFSSSSQALWQHGPSQLFLCLTIYWLVKGLDQPRFSAYAGLALASAIICRPTNALMAMPIVAYLAWHQRDQLGGFLLAGLPPMAMLIAYNTHYFGSPFTTGFTGKTGPSTIWSGASFLFSTPLDEGLAGILVSPGRGLFVYSPILLVAIAGMVMIWREPKSVLLKYLSLAPLPVFFLTAKWQIWWGGGSYGPRLLADITPILCLYLYPPFELAQSRRLLKYPLTCVVALSIALHALRVFAPGDWNGHPNVDRHPERLWSWYDSPPVYYAQNLMWDTHANLSRLIRRLPTSRDAPHKLAALYRVLDVPPGRAFAPKSFMLCQVQAVNTGEAVWLARAKWEKGEVRLRWRWFAGDHDIPSVMGGWLLRYDVLPGQIYTFTLEIPTPPEAGMYTLELSLVSISVTTFVEQGIAPVTIPVSVTR